MYIIYTDSNGEQFIIRGGPKTKYGMLTDNINIVDIPYTYDNKDFHRDWDDDASHLRIEIARGSDAEMRGYYEKMQAAGRAINLEKLDYKIPFTGHLQNSNTSAKHIVEAAGLEFKIPTYADGKEALVPGANSTFKHTFVDTITDREIMPRLYSDQYIKSVSPDYKTVTFFNKDSGLEVYTLNTNAQKQAGENSYIVPGGSIEQVSTLFKVPASRVKEYTEAPLIFEDNIINNAERKFVILPEESKPYLGFYQEASSYVSGLIGNSLDYFNPVKLYRKADSYFNIPSLREVEKGDAL